MVVGFSLVAIGNSSREQKPATINAPRTKFSLADTDRNCQQTGVILVAGQTSYARIFPFGGCYLFLGNENMHVTTLLYTGALRCEPPGSLRQRGRVVKVVLRESFLDGVCRLQSVVVWDSAVHL